MWGYANERNRTLGKTIYELILSEKITKTYNQQGLNYKGYDQSFLRNYVWPHAKLNSTSHDSYNCMHFGGEPFPKKRPDHIFCFSTCSLPCCDINLEQSIRMPECPNVCRPIEHQDWIYC